MKLPRIAITGSSGFLGTHFLKRVKANYYLYNKGGLISGIIDYNPEYIYHFAAEIYNEDDMFLSNVVLTKELLEASRSISNLKAFIYVGSSSEYGRKTKPMKETDFLDPTTMYEATKGAGTLLCQAFAKSCGVPVVIARPFSLYGEFEPKHRFIPTIIKSIYPLTKKRTLLKVSPGVHDFIHIDDFIDGLLMLAENPQPGEIYNFGTGVQTSNEELVKLIEKIVGRKTHKQIIPPLHAYDSDSWVADNTKAKKLGWTARSLEDGLKQVINRRAI